MSLFSRSNGKFYTSRTFWTFFFSYLVLLTVTVTIMAAASWYNTIQRANRETEQKNLEMVRNISAQINDQLAKTCNEHSAAPGRFPGFISSIPA